MVIRLSPSLFLLGVSPKLSLSGVAVCRSYQNGLCMLATPRYASTIRDTLSRSFLKTQMKMKTKVWYTFSSHIVRRVSSPKDRLSKLPPFMPGRRMCIAVSRLSIYPDNPIPPPRHRLPIVHPRPDLQSHNPLCPWRTSSSSYTAARHRCATRYSSISSTLVAE